MRLWMVWGVAVCLVLGLSVRAEAQQQGGGRLRVIVETDAGGDPDDEQSLVRFLLYAGEWDVEGIIANRPVARERENKNPVRDGLGIVRRHLDAYGEVHGRLKEHDGRFPTKEAFWAVTVPGYDDRADGVELIVRAVDKDDPRPIWFMNWGTDKGSAESCLKRALDKVLKERGAAGYAAFKSKLFLSSADKFGDHTWDVGPAFPIWVAHFMPDMDGGRWYRKFSPLTKTAGGFDIRRDVLEGHGPLGPLYPLNTGPPQKEGDSPMFLYLVPNGLNVPMRPDWGAWSGRYGKIKKDVTFPHDAGARNYWSPNVRDTVDGKTSRDFTLTRWAAHLQNDFAARMDWCVKPYGEANHPPRVVVGGMTERTVQVGEVVALDASGSSDPDGQTLAYRWWVYPEAGGYEGPAVAIAEASSAKAKLTVPDGSWRGEIHVILEVTDAGTPALTRYGRVVLRRGE